MNDLPAARKIASGETAAPEADVAAATDAVNRFQKKAKQTQVNAVDSATEQGVKIETVAF